MIAMNFSTEWLVGMIREAVKRRATARHGTGLFAGLSPAAEPRLFDGRYHHDLGMVRFGGGALEFTGDLAHFSLDRRLVNRIWLGNGPRFWTPRKVVYVECRISPEAPLTIFSLQSFEAWFWPWTITAAKHLLHEIENWKNGSSDPLPPPLPCPLPQVEGSPESSVSMRTVFRSVAIYSGIALVFSTMEPWMDGAMDFDLSSQFVGPIVCGILAVFVLWPNLDWRKVKALPNSPSRLPAE
jgi:hypothetical protein